MHSRRGSYQGIHFVALTVEKMNAIKRELLMKEWNYTLIDVDELCKVFITNIETTINNIAPREKRLVKHRNTWVDREVKSAQPERNSQYEKFIDTRY